MDHYVCFGKKREEGSLAMRRSTDCINSNHKIISKYRIEHLNSIENQIDNLYLYTQFARQDKNRRKKIEVTQVKVDRRRPASAMTTNEYNVRVDIDKVYKRYSQPPSSVDNCPCSIN